MKARFLLVVPILILSAHTVFGATKQITLKDGSVIKGEPVSLEGGIYTVQTDNLGRLQLPEANVVTIAAEGAAPMAQPQGATPQMPGQGGTADAGFSGKVSAMQNQIMSNPQTMQTIQAMAEDPEIAAMMSDPAFVQELTAAASGKNAQEVVNNPKVQKLMANPKMQILIQQLQGGAPQQ